MKNAFIRAIAIILMVTACVPLAACGGKENVTVNMDDVVKANNSTKILSDFDNYLVKWDKSKDDMPANVLIADEFLYCDDGKVPEMYLRSTLASYEKSNGTYVATVRFEDDVNAYLANEYFERPLIDENAANETVLAATADEHHISISTRLSAERSQKIVDSFGDTGAFEYVKASYILDRDKLSIIELAYHRVRKDGAEVEFAKGRVEYNSKGNWDAENMYDHVTDTDHGIYTVRVEIVSKANSDKKIVPALVHTDDLIELRLGEEYEAVYSDWECTMPYKSNGKYDSNITLYCKSSSELPLNADISDVVAENTSENILKIFDNYTVQVISASGKVTKTVVLTDRYSYISGNGYPALYLSDGRSFEYERERYVATIRRPSDVQQFKADNFAAPLLTPDMTADEIVKTETVNSYFIITARLTEERAYAITSRYAQQKEYKDVIVKYTVNRSPLLIDTISYYGISDAGEEVLIITVKATYNSIDVEAADKMYRYVTDTSKKTRTITVTLDPGTADECVLSAAARIGDPIAMRLGDEYKTTYTDRECTVKYRSNGRYDTDEFLYCKRATT